MKRSRTVVAFRLLMLPIVLPFAAIMGAYAGVEEVMRGAASGFRYVIKGK